MGNSTRVILFIIIIILLNAFIFVLMISTVAEPIAKLLAADETWQTLYFIFIPIVTIIFFDWLMIWLLSKYILGKEKNDP